MAWIELVAPEDAEGALKRQYDAAVKRAGRIWNVVRLMSPNPEVLKASMFLYSKIMHGPGELSRPVREMLAVVVSRTNECHY